MPDCGCAGNSTTPPGTTPGSVNAPLGTISSFGGTAVVPRGTCGPARCPQPPTSDSEERQPYCPDWTELLTGNPIGRLILMVGSCLFTLKSKCSGYLFYDGTTEEVSVVNPPFVSSIPKETNYGFFAKVVPTLTTICVDGDEECRQEIRQELAAQVLGDASCGELIVANAPLCGELPAAESADAQKQARIDYMKAADQEAAGCPKELRFLAYYMGKRGSGQSAVDCKMWVAMRTLKMRQSQWGLIAKGNPLAGSTRSLVLVPVPGGSADDPCWEARMMEEGQGGIPSGTENCQGLVWKGQGTETEGWVAQELGFRRIWLAAPQTLVYQANNTVLSRYQEMVDKYCEIRAVVHFQQRCILAGSAASGGWIGIVNNFNVAAAWQNGPGAVWLFGTQMSVILPTQNLVATHTFTGVGTQSFDAREFTLLGYDVR